MLLEDYTFQSIFDSVDAVLSLDDATVNTLGEMAEDAKYGDMPLTEAMENIMEDGIPFSLLEDCDVNCIDPENPTSAASIMAHDMMADEYISAYQDFMSGETMSTGDMIDLVADTI